jgi:hypothetical protein
MKGRENRRSLANTERREDLPQYVLGVDPPGDAVKGAGGEADVLGGELQVLVVAERVA